MRTNITSETFYHIYPLGACGAPSRNDFTSPAGAGIRKLIDSLPRLSAQGITAIYIGPLFESTAHGYDTLDYRWVDRRLGTNDDLKAFTAACHARNIKVVLDAVLNHTGRHFFAFRDLQERGVDSPYRDWYRGVDFSGKSPLGDGFSYEGWSGHYDLAKLDTGNPGVREHLFSAVRFWIETFDIDGLRLDAADVLPGEFMDALAAFTRSLKGDFWLLGEVVHGDYREWAREGRLDSVTNYELYKGLWSSFNDENFFEIAWTLNRQFGHEGMYRHLALYNFADNHDVVRVASVLKKPGHLFPLYGLLFTVPGVPSIYYGSEWAIEGERTEQSDAALRPALDLESDRSIGGIGADLAREIARFIKIRKDLPALREGEYRQLFVASRQFAFSREITGGTGRGVKVIVAVNAADTPETIDIAMPESGVWTDALDGNARFEESDGTLSVSVGPSWLRILVKD